MTAKTYWRAGDGVQLPDSDKTADCITVDDSEHLKMLADGWSESPWDLDAIQFAPEPDEKTELIAQAEALGIDVDRRWSVVRLRREIGAKNGDNNEVSPDQVRFL
jgi:hypothetical protein